MMGDIFIVCMGVVCYIIGFFFGKVFGRSKKKDEPCETLEDILNREG